MEKIVQTAGRKALGEFAPQFSHFNDDILFGENWNNQDIDEQPPHTRDFSRELGGSSCNLLLHMV